MACTDRLKKEMRFTSLLASCAILYLSTLVSGCAHPHKGARYDRPFPLGQVTDSFWETQQTNAEAADFVFYDHEFSGNTAELAPGTKQHLESIALRLEHVPFPVVIEQSPHDARPDLDQARRSVILENLVRMGVSHADDRVVIAPAFVEGFTATEGERAYYGIFGGRFGFGSRSGGRGTFGR